MSYWTLDSLEELKDRAKVGWGKAHGGVSLDSKGLSGQAIQLDGVSGWIDLGDLSTAYPEAGCSEDFSISMWFKYNPKESNEDQNFLTLGKGSASNFSLAREYIFKTNDYHHLPFSKSWISFSY